MQFYCGTYTSSTVDIYGLLEARGETIRLYKNARDQARIQKNFPGGGGGRAELPTLNFNKQKKKGKRGGVSGGFQFWDSASLSFI